MGLLFPLQIDLRKSSPQRLVIKTHKQSMSLGGMLMFLFLLLSTMALAAAPLFKALWEDGTFFDRLLTGTFYIILICTPVVSLTVWMLKKIVIVEKKENFFHMETYWSILGSHWRTHKVDSFSLETLRIQNWVGSKNMARLLAEEKGNMDRYGTRGHWMLVLNNLVLERRASKDDIVELQNSILFYFGREPNLLSKTSQNVLHSTQTTAQT